MFERRRLAVTREASAAKLSPLPRQHQTFRCPVCGKEGDGDNISEMLEHHQHIIHSDYYSYLRSGGSHDELRSASA